MVQLNPFNVIMLVYVTFSALNLSTSPITSEEREMAHKIESMLKEMRDERYKMEVEESLDYENDNDIPTAEQFELGDKEEEGELWTQILKLYVLQMDVFRMNIKKMQSNFGKAVQQGQEH